MVVALGENRGMSHEGIRFVSEEDARRADREGRELPKEAIEPVRVKVHKTEGTGMDIQWKDGHQSSWTFRWLRDGCPCATCNEEREKEGRRPGQPKAAPKELLPFYKAPPLPEKVTPIGRYAVSFGWNDGHTSGIYSWDYLRRHCLCEVCGQG
jgi:DUF971 family protein